MDFRRLIWGTIVSSALLDHFSIIETSASPIAWLTRWRAFASSCVRNDR